MKAKIALLMFMVVAGCNLKDDVSRVAQDVAANPCLQPHTICNDVLRDIYRRIIEAHDKQDADGLKDALKDLHRVQSE